MNRREHAVLSIPLTHKSKLSPIILGVRGLWCIGAFRVRDTKDRVEGFNAFLGKRKPVFRGE